MPYHSCFMMLAMILAVVSGALGLPATFRPSGELLIVLPTYAALKLNCALHVRGLTPCAFRASIATTNDVCACNITA
jgi:hypothetical protein